MEDEQQLKIPVNPIDFNVLVGGPADGPVVVLSHALMANLHMWDSTVRALHKAGYRTIRFDHVGHGGTSRPSSAKEYHFDDFTKFMYSVIVQSIGIAGKTAYTLPPRVHAIIGCSMGGVIALRFSMLFPESVAKVIACDAPGLDALELSKPKWQARMAEFREKGSQELCQKTVDRWFPPPCDEDTKAAALKQVQTCTLEGYEACAKAIQTYQYRDELATKVKAQTMILVGENDEAVGPPEVLEDVANQIQDAKYVRVKDAGHLPPMHQPQEFERIVLEFLS